MNDKNWFVHVEWVVVLVTLLGGFYLLDGKIERQGERTDKLYEMFCSLQKESMERHLVSDEKWNQKWLNLKIENDQRYYDLIKEKK